MVSVPGTWLPTMAPLVIAVGGTARESRLSCTWLAVVACGSMLVLFSRMSVKSPGTIAPVASAA